MVAEKQSCMSLEREGVRVRLQGSDHAFNTVPAQFLGAI
jgi:hypothetical protein